MLLYCFYSCNCTNISISVELTYVQDSIIHAKLCLLLQSSQRLRVLIAQVTVQSKPGTETCAVIQSSEGEHVAPAIVTPTVVDCNYIGEEELFNMFIW